MSKSRQLSIYEKNQLLKYSLEEAELLTKGDLPIEYFTGHVNFRNLELKINQNVLIPRVETEELIDLLNEFALSLDDDLSYLEVGTGSGAISLAFFDFLIKHRELKVENFIVTDFSKDALEVAKSNFEKIFPNKIDQINFIQSDLLDEINNKQFNLIAANLPYIPSKNIANLDVSVKDYEPVLALDGGETGFELIEKMLKQILEKNALAKNGKIFLEVDETHTLDFIKTNFPLIYQRFSIQEIKDQFARHRFLILQQC